MAFTLPKIIYPSQPAVPPQPNGFHVTGGSLPAADYFFVVTYVTPWGESQPSPENNFTLGLNQVLKVFTTTPPALPSVATGWNVYVSTSSGTETRQNTFPTAIGTDWIMPTTGLIAGAPIPPSTWGGTLSFQRQPQQVPYDVVKAIRHDSFSTAGFRQAVNERVEHYLTLVVDNINIGADVAAWDGFLLQATQGIPFDYYVDSTSSNYLTYSLVEMDRPLTYKSMGLYTLTLTFRQEISQTSNVTVSAPTNTVKTIAFTTVASGNFTVAHGLGYVPNYFGAPLLTSAGSVWFQATMVDNKYVYLTASGASITGFIAVG